MCLRRVVRRFVRMAVLHFCASFCLYRSETKQFRGSITSSILTSASILKIRVVMSHQWKNEIAYEVHSWAMGWLIRSFICISAIGQATPISFMNEASDTAKEKNVRVSKNSNWNSVWLCPKQVLRVTKFSIPFHGLCYTTQSVIKIRTFKEFCPVVVSPPTL